jgi:hypothetical protein
VDLDEQTKANIPSTGLPALALPVADRAPTVRFIEGAKDAGHLMLHTPVARRNLA